MKLHKFKPSESDRETCRECGEVKTDLGHFHPCDDDDLAEYDWQRDTSTSVKKNISMMLFVLFLETRDKQGAFCDLANTLLDRLDEEEAQEWADKLFKKKGKKV